MRRRPPRASRVLLVLSVILAAGTTLALREHLARVEARAALAGPGVTVVVAARDLPRGTLLTSTVLREEALPARYRPPGALPGLDAAVGRPLAADVVAGEVVTAARLAPSGGPVASLVPAGLRAVAIAVPLPPESLVPGDRVDVLATFATARPYTDTVVQGAEVLGVLGQSSTEVGTATTVVLLVSPDVAERLAYARAFADLSVTVAPTQVTETVPPWTTEAG